MFLGVNTPEVHRCATGNHPPSAKVHPPPSSGALYFLRMCVEVAQSTATHCLNSIIPPPHNWNGIFKCWIILSWKRYLLIRLKRHPIIGQRQKVPVFTMTVWQCDRQAISRQLPNEILDFGRFHRGQSVLYFWVNPLLCGRHFHLSSILSVRLEMFCATSVHIL